MSKEDIYADVVIAGGGPSGTTAAALLAKSGWNVILLERERFPRFQIGESLLPYNNDLFHDLGIWDALCEGDYVEKRGAEFVTADGLLRQKFIFSENLPPQYHRSFQVRRADFDELLLNNARRHGAAVHEGVRIAAVDLDEPGSCVVETVAGDGSQQRIRGRYLVDASGANGQVTARYVRRREREGLRKVSWFAHYHGAELAEDGSRDITIAVLRNGWCWIIPVDDETTSFGIVIDRDLAARAGGSKESLLEQTIAESAYLRRRMGSAVRVGEVRARKDFSYRVDRITGSNFVLVGDAAGFIDPIFSTGVFLAMKGASVAAAALDENLRTGSQGGLKRYEKRMERALRRYFRFIESFYRREFIEIFLHPHPRFGLVKVINGMLAGNVFETVMSRWRLELFYFLVRLQGRFGRIAPTISWDTLPAVPVRVRAPEVGDV